MFERWFSPRRSTSPRGLLRGGSLRRVHRARSGRLSFLWMSRDVGRRAPRVGSDRDARGGRVPRARDRIRVRDARVRRYDHTQGAQSDENARDGPRRVRRRRGGASSRVRRAARRRRLLRRGLGRRVQDEKIRPSHSFSRRVRPEAPRPSSSMNRAYNCN